jgi:protein phosphatase
LTADVDADCLGRIFVLNSDKCCEDVLSDFGAWMVSEILMSILKGIRYFALTDIGLKRSQNEDAYAVYQGASNTKGALFVLADGIGGHACGDIASQLACGGMSAFFDGFGGKLSAEECVARLEKLVHSTDDSIRDQGEKDPACTDMGTTLSGLLVTEDFAVTAHVGDSRIYRLRRRKLEQLTTDHTFVQDMIAEKVLSEKDAAHHPLRHVLTRSVGTPERLESVETSILEILRGDRFLLCTDGLHDMLPFRQIRSLLLRHSDPQTATEQLLRKALNNGGRDNVTLIVVDP